MAWKPEEIYGVLLECGNLALDIQHSAERSIKSDNTIVTEADTRIEALIEERLARDEGTYFIGEETSKTHGEDYHRQALEGECYVIDPVDGTVLYSNQLPGWGVSIGFMDRGVLAEGAIYYPFSGEMIISDGDRVFYARGGERETRNSGRGSEGNAERDVPAPAFSDLRPLEPPRPRSAGNLISISQTIVKWGRYNGSYSVLCTGSCVSSMLQIALGGSIGYLTRTRLWDLAAGMPILSKLGIRAFFTDGREFTTDVTEDSWFIPPVDARHHWRMKDHAVFCADRETAESILNQSSMP